MSVALCAISALSACAPAYTTVATAPVMAAPVMTYAMPYATVMPTYYAAPAPVFATTPVMATAPMMTAAPMMTTAPAMIATQPVATRVVSWP